ncbi:MAG: conjugative transposon protein TraN [Prevotellaceae bacterium]|jgi:conjugative transposon TraN protein|nr:conjugative transposon protein TraN [Prevotellaceae bacterium]
MKQIFLMLAIIASVVSANAQEQPSTGDLFNGLTRPLTFNRMIPPYALEVTFSKTVHIIFPTSVRYVDLGSIDLLAAKADGAENVLRVKAATQGFRKESNLSVITEDGSYYTFNVKYADEPVKLSVEMSDFLHGWNAENKPGNELPVLLSDLGQESPFLVRLIMETVHKNNHTKIKHIGSKNFGVSYLLKGVYSHNDLLFFHLALKNTTTVSFDVEYLVFKIVDKKVAKRTAIQEQVIIPLRSYNQLTTVAGGKEERTVFTLPKFTIPNDKQLVIELTEKDGGRNQTLTVENADLIRAEEINNLQVQIK